MLNNNWMLVINNNGEETTKFYSTKGEAREQLNKMVREFKEADKSLGTYYQENSSWYALKILASKKDIADESDPVAEGKCPSVYLEIKMLNDEE